MSDFDNKVVIVTGGGYGIGESTAKSFGDEGASVTVLDIDEDAGRRTVDSIKSNGGKALFVLGDVSQGSDCERAVNETVNAFGGVDILFNNAGIQPPDWYVKIEEYSEEMWDKIIGVNLRGYFLMMKYALPEIRKRGSGSVINVASVHSFQSQKGVPAYDASKGAIVALTKQVALDYAEDNIRILAVCPGAMDTKLLRTMAEREADPEKAVEDWGKTHPLGRIGTGQDIANMALFLASEKASFMTGESVLVDGGYMALGAWAVIDPSKEE